MAIKNLKAIETMLNLAEGTLQKAFENDQEIDIEIPKLHIRTPEQETQLLTNIEKEKKERYDAGLEVGGKRMINDSLEKFGITLADEKKNLENFATAYKEKILTDAKLEPDKKIKELETDNEKLRNNYKTLETDFNTFKTSIAQQEEKRTIENSVLSAIKSGLPEGKKFIIPENEIALIAGSRFKFKVDNNVIRPINQEGEFMKDQISLQPLEAKDVINANFLKTYIQGAEGGTGGDDEPGGGNGTQGSYEAFQKEMEGKGHKPGSETFQREMNERIKNKTLQV